MNNKGFTITEGLVATILTTIIVVGVMTTISLFSLSNQKTFIQKCLIDANNYAIGLCKTYASDNNVNISNINTYKCGSLNITNSINPNSCAIPQNTCRNITFTSSYNIFKLSQTVRICN
jgi:hypothetical protein